MKLDDETNRKFQHHKVTSSSIDGQNHETSTII